MIAELNFGGQKIRAALDRGVSLAIAVEFGSAGPRHFGAGAPSSTPFAIGTFTGSVATGASGNCSTITLNPHCQMTHTESVAHLTRESGDAWRVVPRGLLPAVVVSVLPEPARESSESTDPQPWGTDTLITRRRLRAAWPMGRMVDPVAAVIRTLPNDAVQTHARLHRPRAAVPHARSGRMAGREAHRAPGARRSLASTAPTTKATWSAIACSSACRPAAPRAAMRRDRAPPSPNSRSSRMKWPTAPACWRWRCPPSAATPFPASRLCILWRHERLADSARHDAMNCCRSSRRRGTSRWIAMPRTSWRRIASSSSCRCNASGQPLIYLCGHSLGLAPRAALDYVSEELADWAALGVGGHHTATRPWIDYAQNFTKGLQHVTGALANEVVAMNSLTDQPAPDDGVVLPAGRHARQGAHRGRRVFVGPARHSRAALLAQARCRTKR